MARSHAGGWHLSRRLGDGVTLISETAVMLHYRCNIWHVRGRDRDMLVASGS
jgi:hypothetical protein